MSLFRKTSVQGEVLVERDAKGVVVKRAPPVPGAPAKISHRAQVRALTEGLIGMGLGAMNEVIEFVGTLIFPNTNVGGYVNTGWDLVCNMTGCIAAVGVVHVWEARSRRVPLGTV